MAERGGPEFGNDRVDPRVGERLKKTAQRAIEEAGARGSATVEAEHILLALAGEASIAGTVLGESGLDHAAIAAMLDDERRKSLEVAGFTVSADELRSTPRDGRLGWGASAKEALRRAAAEGHAERGLSGGPDRGRARRRAPDEGDLLIGVLGADLGTVPRALAYAGVETRPIIEKIRTARG
jgi:hypothetical protein